MRKTKFQIESLGEISFDGYTRGEEWNGWQCPYFDFQESEKIMALHNTGTSRTWFNAENDQFVFNFEDGEEYYQAIQEDGKKLYPIGNGNWIWEEKTAV